jgi:hypothetical protein
MQQGKILSMESQKLIELHLKLYYPSLKSLGPGGGVRRFLEDLSSRDGIFRRNAVLGRPGLPDLLCHGSNDYRCGIFLHVYRGLSAALINNMVP